MGTDLSPSQLNDFLLYKTPNGNIEVELFRHNENLWLNQAQLAKLFDVDRSVITKHLKNIYTEEELQKEATCAFFAHVRKEGEREVTRKVEFYNNESGIMTLLNLSYRPADKNEFEDITQGA